MIGVAKDRGLIPDLTAPVTQYVTALRGSGFDGEQLVSAEWANRSRGSDNPLLQVGALGEGAYPHYGYANQWWTLGGAEKSFTGLGVHGQYLWVDPEAEVVIVKTSAWDTADDENRDAATVSALKALSAALTASRP